MDGSGFSFKFISRSNVHMLVVKKRMFQEDHHLSGEKVRRNTKMPQKIYRIMMINTFNRHLTFILTQNHKQLKTNCQFLITYSWDGICYTTPCK